MEQRNLARRFVLAVVFLFGVLGCRTTDLIARANPTPTITVTATAPPTQTNVRPTFTAVPPTLPPTLVPPPTQQAIVLPPSPTVRPPTARPAPSRTPTTRPAAPAPTADPYAAWYYKPVNKGCVTAPNTRIQGAVTENGQPKSGLIVRVSDREGGGASIDDFLTGTDPDDNKHTCPECAGKYVLKLYEGQQNAGNWWVFLIDDKGNQLSPGVLVTTQDNGGCNTATIDFRH